MRIAISETISNQKCGGKFMTKYFMNHDAIRELQKIVMLHKQNGYTEVGKPYLGSHNSRKYLCQDLAKVEDRSRIQLTSSVRVTPLWLNRLVQRIISEQTGEYGIPDICELALKDLGKECRYLG